MVDDPPLSHWLSSKGPASESRLLPARRHVRPFLTACPPPPTLQRRQLLSATPIRRRQRASYALIPHHGLRDARAVHAAVRR